MPFRDTVRRVGASVAGAILAISGAPNADRAAVLSEPTPSERGVSPAPDEYGTDAELVALVKERTDAALLQRRQAERDWVLNIAMYFGGRGQWLKWDDTHHHADTMMTDGDMAKCRYVNHNLIRPLTQKIIGLTTMTKPDAQVAPASDAKIDRDAAGEARSITAHLGRLHKRPIQMLSASWWSTVCGIVYHKSYWDAAATADIAYFDQASGQMGKKSAPVGEVCSSVVSPFEILIDNRTSDYEKARWLIHFRDLTPSEVEEMYGDRAKNLEPDSVGASGYIDRYMPETRGQYNSSDTSKRNAVRVYECWEKKTKRFPNGRLIVTTGTHRLYAGVNPLEGTDAKGFPVARLVYEESPNHVYGSSLLTDLRDIQIDTNRLLTKATTSIEDAKNTLLRNKLGGEGADAYHDDEITEKRNFREVHYNTGFEPKWQEQPTVSADIWRLVDLSWLHMQHIAGIHDVNMGGTTGGLTAGISIELVQQGDRTQLGLYTQRIEQFAVDRDTLDIALYGKYAGSNLPRLMGVDDTGNPEAAQSRAMAFRALCGGGSVRVIVSPGSATPKSPSARQQEVIAFKEAGLFDIGDPGADIAVKLLPNALSGRILELREQAKQEAAQQAEADQQAQMQAQMQAQQQQFEQQAALQDANRPEPGADPREVEATKAQLRMRETEQKAQLTERQKILDAAIQVRMQRDNGPDKRSPAKR